LFFSILEGGQTGILLEHFIKALLVRKTYAQRDVTDFKACVGQKFLSPVDPDFEQVIDRAHSGFFLESPCKIAWAEKYEFCNIPKRNIPLEIGVDEIHGYTDQFLELGAF
jgi:hypothetical protein